MNGKGKVSLSQLRTQSAHCLLIEKETSAWSMTRQWQGFRWEDKPLKMDMSSEKGEILDLD